jgi:hypothetical protein
VIERAILGSVFDVPVDPNAPDATEWLISELSKPVYRAAQPTAFDRVAKAIGDWLASLQFGNVQGPPALALAVMLLLVVLGIVVAFFVFGLPRVNRRTAIAGTLFGEDDDRTADRIRLDAEAAAQRGDYSTAIAEMFRAIARGLAERTILTTTPGTTARDFGARAGILFEGCAVRLAEAASDFDLVRYLERDGTPEQFARVAALETELRSSRPSLELASV